MRDDSGQSLKVCLFLTLRPTMRCFREIHAAVRYLKMLRGIFSVLPTKIAPNIGSVLSPNKNEILGFLSKSLIQEQNANFTSTVPAVSTAVSISSQWISKYTQRLFLEPQKIHSYQIRTVTKFSLKKGTRKSVKAVTTRFFRLNWGIWIRTMSGRHKKLWKKSANRRNRLLNHVFCNATQSKMLDKMVTKFWRRPKYYIEDPYEPYQQRNNFYITQRKPWRPEGVDYE